MAKLSCLRSINHPDELAPLIRSVVGAQAGLADCRVINQDEDYSVLFARLSHPGIDVVVKLAGPKARMASQFDRTAILHKLVSENTAISMPETFALDVSLEKWPWRYLIRAFIPGTEWAYLREQMSESELAGAYRQIGDAVGQLHQIAFPAFGDIDPSGRVSNLDPGCTFALIRHAAHIIRSPRLLDAFLAALEQRSVWFDGVVDSSLCHEDLHGNNILFSRSGGQWRLTTILDFDKAWAGHAETDLARLELWTGMTSPDFWEMYFRLRHLDADYIQRRPIYQLLWCLEYARSTPQHLADTRRVCSELGIPVIDSFD
jgi:Ser/Thr protein kinase RdoA (MazF antagonist)